MHLHSVKKIKKKRMENLKKRKKNSIKFVRKIFNLFCRLFVNTQK